MGFADAPPSPDNGQTTGVHRPLQSFQLLFTVKNFRSDSPPPFIDV
jgi:hypothetical protein